MSTGTVKWFDCKKGYGFVVTSEGADVFVHYSSIEGEGFRSLKEGEVVEFEQATGPNGLYAKKIVRDAAAAAGKAPANLVAAPVKQQAAVRAH